MAIENESKSLSIWLFICCFMIIVVLAIGGFTRLKKAGLSITEWRPIIGIIPPLSNQDWIREKLKYEITPEYKAFYSDMSMEEFKVIYLIEYTHRLSARFAGIIFILPLIYFLWKRKISIKLAIILLIVLLLGVMQAYVGWYMVNSGLIKNPYVSHYRLAFHLLLALVIFSLLFFQSICNKIKIRDNVTVSNYSIIYITLALILTFIQIIFGAFVAGLNAGLLYNTFPLMNGEIIPNDLFFFKPIWMNFLENRITVQFIHRVLALIILLLICIVVMKNIRLYPLYITLLLIIIQITLGIITLLFKVPVVAAILHQMFSFILFASNLYSLCYLIQVKNWITNIR
ncbi:COX15/CtaA family protein [Wolbachia endosymbiont of Pentidionis agamae]|uniref:COX15/CtaA family protein n=1 Tax=Wolbachia endosymbiont of Pentidionis agamae TaxID=3110435 RepID=UPI002FD043D6